MPTHDLAHSTPSAEGVDAVGIEAFLDAMQCSPQTELHSVMVLRHGKIIAEGWRAPYSVDRVHLLYSLSKSFTATAAGFAVAEGIIDLDATVLSYFPELDAEVTDPGSRAIKVRQVASMASGHLGETRPKAFGNDPANPVRGFLLIPPDRSPGTVFAYNQPCTYSLAAIIQRRSGQRLLDYLRPRLFDPLGIDDVAWVEQPPGQNIGYSGMYATTDAVARLGQLYLQRGRWDGRQLLPAAWVDQATGKQIDTPREPNPDWQQGYGFQFWRSRHGYRGDGAFGQFCLVLPDQDMVVAITAESQDMQGILDAVWRHVLPAVDSADPDPQADGRLAARLGRDALPVIAAEAEPGEPFSRTGAKFTGGPSSGHHATGIDERVGPVITEAALHGSAEGWELSITDPGGRLDIRVGTGRWAMSESGGIPVAANGGWVDRTTFVADVVFVETPHKVRVTCSVRSGVVTSHWFTISLQSTSMAELRRP